MARPRLFPLAVLALLPSTALADPIEYEDTTPICHYLNRGVNDQQSGQRDTYVVMPGTYVKTLRDIREISLGLDIPETHCQDNPRTNPCSDEDAAKRWCVESLQMTVAGITLYDESDADCLMHVRGGLGGTRTIDNAGLRLNNPNWGFSVEELEPYINLIRQTPDGRLQLVAPGVTFSGPYLERVLEAAVGDLLSRMNKSSNPNATFQGAKRGLSYRYAGNDYDVPVSANADDPSCNLSPCPSRSQRLPDPWVELRGQPSTSTLRASLDMSVYNGTVDPGDCLQNNSNPWDLHCGTLYTYLASAEVQTDIGFPCYEYALVEVDGFGTRRFPYCDGATPIDRFCVDKEGLASNPTWFISCTDEDALDDDLKPLCDAEVELLSTYYNQDIAIIGDTDVSASGWLANILDFFCGYGLFGCGADDFTKSKLDKIIGDGGILGMTLFERLDGCPGVSVLEDGRVNFDLTNLDNCPDGAGNPSCFPGGILEQPQLPNPAPSPGEDPGSVFSTVLAARANRSHCQDLDGDGRPECSPDRTRPALTQVVEAGPTLPVRQLTRFVDFERGQRLNDITERFLGYFGLIAERTPRFIVRVVHDILGFWTGLDATVQSSDKIPMREIDEAFVAVCAAGRSCNPATFDPTRLPLAEIAELGPAGLAAAVEGGDLTQIDFLLNNEEFVTSCLEFNSGQDLWDEQAGQPINPLATGLAALAWYNDAFEPELNAAGGNSCRATSQSIEDVFPVPAVELRIGTGAQGATDEYAFANFADVRDLSDSTAGKTSGERCENLERSSLPSAQVPKCGADGRFEGERCGEVAGGPCADLAAPYYGSMWLLGKDPEEREFHPNGDYSFHHRCDYDIDTGLQMSCVEEFFPGAGFNYGPVCKVCGEPGPNDDPSLFTMVGCEAPNTGCPNGLFLGSDGRCWDTFRGFPSWECEIDCEEAYNGYGWCMNGANWRTLMESKHPDLDAYKDADYGLPVCADWSCDDHGIACAASGEACNFDQCVTECSSDSDCAAGNPAPQYPTGFSCIDGTCRGLWTVNK